MNLNVVNALAFLIDAVFGIYILLVMLRFLIHLLRVGFRDAPSQFLLAATNPPLKILYQFIPGWRSIDFAAIVLMFALQIFKLVLTFWLFGKHLAVLPLFLIATISLLSLLFKVFFISIILEAILSWITPPNSYNPLNSFLYRFNEPILRPIRRRIPLVSGVDLSPLIVTLLLWTLIILLGW